MHVHPALSLAAALAAILPAAPGCGAPVPCSTGAYWTEGDEESPLMHPGGDCIGCHAGGEEEGPLLSVGGTVMAERHDATDCYGVDGVVVQITDATGTVRELTTNASGNFFLRAEDGVVVPPYEVTLFANGRSRSMLGARVETNCMACHTRDGAHRAPGRILVP